MKAHKRKCRELSDARRGKKIRKGKGPLVANISNGDLSPEEDDVSLVTIPVSQHGRRVSAPKRLSDYSTEVDVPCSSTPTERAFIPTPGFRVIERPPIPTPGFRLIDDYDSYFGNTDNENTEKNAEETAEMDAERHMEKNVDENVEGGGNRCTHENFGAENEDVNMNPEADGYTQDTDGDGERDEGYGIRASKRSAGKAMYEGVLMRGRTCSCSILVVEFDRGWREQGATVEMFSGHRGWYICAMLQGESLFIQDIKRKYFNYTTNRITGAYIWKAEQGWMLEFDTYSQLSIFKKLYQKCFQKNQKVYTTLQAPAPKFRVVKDLDPRWRGPAFIRPANRYIPVADVDMDSRVLYDMDSEDEKWLNELNGKAGTYKQKISEHKFEKAVYCLEKYSYERHELLSAETASVLCLHVASLRIIKLVHSYWMEKRRRKGKSLVRHFQSEPWKKGYQEPGQGKSPSSSESVLCMPPEGESAGNQNNAPVPPADPAATVAAAKETENLVRVGHVDSPSLPEVCDDAGATAVPEEAESRRPPPQGELVWKKFTGRASAEERKKLKIMNQLKESGIKHFTRKCNVPMKRPTKPKKPPEVSSKSSDDEIVTMEEAARELYALADAAMQKEVSVASDGKSAPSAHTTDEETESDIETLELAREKALEPKARKKTQTQEPSAKPALSKLELHKQRLRQQMKKLKKQMKKVDERMKKNSTQGKQQGKSGLDNLAAWSLEIEKELNRRNKQELRQSKSSFMSSKRSRTRSTRLLAYD